METKMKRINRILCYSTVTILAGVLLLTGTAICKDTITIGRATDYVDKEHKRLHPIITHLALKLRDLGIERGKVVLDGVNDNEAIIRLIQAKKLDMIIETPFSAAQYHYRTGMYPLLLVSREGVIQYNSYIFVRKDSKINCLADLCNKTIAFEDATSTSAYHLPRMAIEEAGHILEYAGKSGQKPTQKVVKYLFAGSELNISSWVFFKKVDAGALSSKDWFTQDECPEAFRKHFKIVHKTKMIPRMMILIRKDLPMNLVNRIKKEFIIMNKTEAGREALELYRLDKFIDSPDTAMQLLSSIQKKLFQNQ